jgi:proline iminopeptidase
VNRRIGEQAPRWEALNNRDRTAAEDREFAVLHWSADFTEPTTARRHAENLATPWLGINYECSTAINAEVKRYLRDTDMAARCRAVTGADAHHRRGRRPAISTFMTATR